MAGAIVRALLASGLLSMSTSGWAQAGFTGPALQVAQAERAFARSMADRDHAAFTGWLSEQAVFFGGAAVLRGKAAVAAGWKPYFDGPKPPFSWEPDQVEVLADGTLAHSSGPVRDGEGRLIARFNSVWRQESPGVWRIVFDKGSPLSDAERKSANP